MRNLTRLIWINVAVPPSDDASKGKFPGATLSTKQLRRKKVEAIKLALVFTFACKHYLRGEDGLDWADYTGILPASVVRLSQPSSRKTSAWTSYSATAKSSRTESREDSSDDDSAQAGQSGGVEVVSRVSTDATKRVRVKRSKDNVKASVKSPATPLLSSGLHAAIDFHSDPDVLTTPLPLM